MNIIHFNLLLDIIRDYYEKKVNDRIFIINSAVNKSIQNHYDNIYQI